MGVFNLDFCISICIILIFRLFVSRHILAFGYAENHSDWYSEIICFGFCNRLLYLIAKNGSLIKCLPCVYN